METQENNAKTPAPSENGSRLKQSGNPETGEVKESNSPAMAEPEEDPVSEDVNADSETASSPEATKNDVAEESTHLPGEGRTEVQTDRENELSPILEVSRRFMAIIKKAPGKGLPGRRITSSVPDPKSARGKVPVSRRLRDWDTRLFVLSTLKRLVDNEHFEELEEEDKQVQFTREAMQVRNKVMAEKNRRQHRKPKIEKFFPIAGLAEKKADESVMRSTREKQRNEKTKQLREKRISTRAGKALNDALQKATYIKFPETASEIPGKEEVQNGDVNLPANERNEQNNEVKEQSPQKRGFFNLR